VPSSVCPISVGLWAMEIWRTSGPADERDSILVLIRFSVLVRAIWRRRCPLVKIMSFIFYHYPDGASSIAGGRVEVCLRRISRGLVGAGLRWICLDSSSFVFVWVFTCLMLLIYDFLHLRLLLLWYASPNGPKHDDFPIVYYNKVCPALTSKER
jgi:hypothetical protein